MVPVVCQTKLSEVLTITKLSCHGYSIQACHFGDIGIVNHGLEFGAHRKHFTCCSWHLGWIVNFYIGRNYRCFCRFCINGSQIIGDLIFVCCLLAVFKILQTAIRCFLCNPLPSVYECCWVMTFSMCSAPIKDLIVNGLLCRSSIGRRIKLPFFAICWRLGTRRRWRNGIYRFVSCSNKNKTISRRACFVKIVFGEQCIFGNSILVKKIKTSRIRSDCK